MNSTLNRRKFLIQSATLATGVALSGCATLDDYLFEDRYDLKDQTLIIGGGLSGLAAAYYLKKRQSEYLVVESASSLGGRIKSSAPYDLGGSLFSKKNQRLRLMAKELKLETTDLDAQNMYFSNGSAELINALSSRLGSLMPYRQVRLRWKLESIKVHRDGYECVFNQPKGKKTLLARKLILAVPPSQWSQIQGLMELPAMENSEGWLKAMKAENVIRVNYPLAKDFRPAAKRLQQFKEDQLSIRQVYRQSQGQQWYEYDFLVQGDHLDIEIQKLNDILRKKSNGHVARLVAENFFDWSSVSSIGAGYFYNSMKFPTLQTLNFQVIGDFAALESPHTMEGALETAQNAVEMML